MSESTHWYKEDGTPFYTIIGKNGKERPVTLKDAKQLGDIYPSVTTIIGLSHKPGLESWKIEQAILSAMTLPRQEDENDQEFMSRVKEDAKEQARRAAELGTKIHGIIEAGIRDKDYRYQFARSVIDTLDTECGKMGWTVEYSFADTDYGYGGKCDLHNNTFLLDIKTTEKDIDSLKLWDEHYMQLAAYDYGIKGGKHRVCGIIYVNVNTTESKLLFINDEEYSKGWECFKALLSFYYAKSGWSHRRS